MNNTFNFGSTTNTANNLFGKPTNAIPNSFNSNNAFGLSLGNPSTNQFGSNTGVGLFGPSKTSNTQSIGSTFAVGNVQNSQGTFGSFNNPTSNSSITQPGSSNTAFQFNKSTFGTNAGSLFGNTSTTLNANNSFGNNNTGLSMGSSSVFSQASTGINFGQPGFSFSGSKQTISDNNTFGSAIANNSSFGSGSNMVLNNTIQSSQFGNIPQTTQFGVTATTNPFGYASPAPLFGGVVAGSFGNSTQTSSFGNSFGNATQASPFGVPNANLGNATVTAPFGNSPQMTSFGGTATTNSFGSMGQTNSNQVVTFGGAKSSPFFSATGQTNSFGGGTPSPVFGSTQKAPTFGTTAQLPSFGVSPQSSFGAMTSTPSFGSVTQGSFAMPASFGSVPTISSFGGITQPSFGAPSQSVSFGNFSTVPSLQTIPPVNISQTNTFGNFTNKPAFGNLTQNSTFGNSTTTCSSTFSFGNAKTAQLGGTAPSSFNAVNTTFTPNVGLSLANVALITPQISLAVNKVPSSLVTSVSMGTIPSPVCTLNSILSPQIGSFVTVSSSILPQTSMSQSTIPSFTGFTSNSPALKQPFSLATTSTPFSINSPSAPPSQSLPSMGFPSNSNTTSATVSQGSQSIFGTPGLGGTTTTKSTFTSPLTVSSTTAKKGLGGSPISNSTMSSQVKEGGQKDSGNKQVKDAELPVELKETVDAFKKFASEQKKIREEIVKAHDAINLIVRVEEECQTLNQSIYEVSNGLLKVQSHCIKMKNNMLKEQSNIKVAQTNADSSFCVGSGISESARYFANKSREFENRVGLYLQEIEVVESLSNSSNSSVITTKELVDIIRNMDDEFIGLAAKLYMVHERVKLAKSDHLRRLKVTHNNHNPFLAIEGRFGESPDSCGRLANQNSGARVTSAKTAMKISDCVGSSPFDSTGASNFVMPRSSSVPQTALFGFNNNNSPSLSTFGSNGPGISLSNASNSSFNRPIGLFSTDGGSNKKRR